MQTTVMGLEIHVSRHSSKDANNVIIAVQTMEHTSEYIRWDHSVHYIVIGYRANLNTNILV